MTPKMTRWNKKHQRVKRATMKKNPNQDLDQKRMKALVRNISLNLNYRPKCSTTEGTRDITCTNRKKERFCNGKRLSEDLPH